MHVKTDGLEPTSVRANPPLAIVLGAVRGGTGHWPLSYLRHHCLRVAKVDNIVALTLELILNF